MAQTDNGIRPLPVEAALASWTNALRIAHDEVEREGVYLHFARIKLLAGRLAEVQAHLNAITNETYATLKQRLSRNLEDRRLYPALAGTNGPPTTDLDIPRPTPKPSVP